MAGPNVPLPEPSDKPKVHFLFATLLNATPTVDLHVPCRWSSRAWPRCGTGSQPGRDNGSRREEVVDVVQREQQVLDGLGHVGPPPARLLKPSRSKTSGSLKLVGA